VNSAFVAGKVFVVDGAAEMVGDCFLAAVRVIGEACARGDGEVVLKGCVSHPITSARGYATRKRTSMRKGVKFFNSLVPTDLLTLAPAPSAWSIASKILRTLRGGGGCGSQGGVIGRNDGETLEGRLCGCHCGIRGCLVCGIGCGSSDVPGCQVG